MILREIDQEIPPQNESPESIYPHVQISVGRILTFSVLL